MNIEQGFSVLRKMQPGVEVKGIQNPSEFFILAVNAEVSFTYQQKSAWKTCKDTNINVN